MRCDGGGHAPRDGTVQGRTGRGTGPAQGGQFLHQHCQHIAKPFLRRLPGRANRRGRAIGVDQQVDGAMLQVQPSATGQQGNLWTRCHQSSRLR